MTNKLEKVSSAMYKIGGKTSEYILTQLNELLLGTIGGVKSGNAHQSELVLTQLEQIEIACLSASIQFSTKELIEQL
jgi:hypothetical protein